MTMIQKKNMQAFFAKNIFFLNLQGVPPAEGEIPCSCASIALWKVVACPEFFGGFPNFTYLIGSLLFFLKIAEEFPTDMGIFFYIKKIIKMYDLVISIP